MIVLGIETSCDETAAAVVREGRQVLSSVVFSQIARHRPYGGVVPEIASRAHVEALPQVITEALNRSKCRWDDLEAIAVTQGPGLVSSLLMGISLARALGQNLGIPVWGVNHLEAHLAGVFLDPAVPEPARAAPLLALMVSGGHTALIEMRGMGQYRLLGQTLDDAAGECLDKGATLLGLGYPGGPAIERAARGGNPQFVNFPRGMQRARPRPASGGAGESEFCFSFSGLKTALLYYLKAHPQDLPRHVADLAASYQEAVMAALAERTERALAETGARTLAAVGGVARNHLLRSKLEMVAARQGAQLWLTPPEYCTDNAAMVAAAAALRVQAGRPNPTVGEADPALPLAVEAS